MVHLNRRVTVATASESHSFQRVDQRGRAGGRHCSRSPSAPGALGLEPPDRLGF